GYSLLNPYKAPATAGALFSFDAGQALIGIGKVQLHFLLLARHVRIQHRGCQAAVRKSPDVIRTFEKHRGHQWAGRESQFHRLNRLTGTTAAERTLPPQPTSSDRWNSDMEQRLNPPFV